MNKASFTDVLPEPYPGECLYSILCRYHVRSGGRPSDTSYELFGSRNVKLSHTVLSARAFMFNSGLLSEQSQIQKERIILQHTAFQLVSLCHSIQWNEDIVAVASQQGRWLQYFGSLNKHGITKRKNRLCYCPQCAKIERKTYGEPYWHTLHQIEGIRYCLVHQTPLIESEAEIFTKKSNQYNPAFIFTKESASRTSQKDPLKVSMLELSEDINWLLHNGIKFGGYEPLIEMYSRIWKSEFKSVPHHDNLGEQNITLHDYVTKELQSSIPHEISHDSELNYGNYILLATSSYCTTFFNPLQHAIYMKYRFDGAIQFFQRYFVQNHAQ